MMSQVWYSLAKCSVFIYVTNFLDPVQIKCDYTIYSLNMYGNVYSYLCLFEFDMYV